MRWRITSDLKAKASACEMADYLDPQAPTLTPMVKESGAATAYNGKWHLGGERDVTDAPKFKEYGWDLGHWVPTKARAGRSARTNDATLGTTRQA